MKEKRKLERFRISVPARIETLTSNDGKATLNVSTSNISSGGAFFCTDRAFPEGVVVKMDLEVPLKSLGKYIDCSGVSVMVRGTVVRSGLNGMAIRFSENYHMVPMQNKLC